MLPMPPSLLMFAAMASALVMGWRSSLPIRDHVPELMMRAFAGFAHGGRGVGACRVVGAHGDDLRRGSARRIRASPARSSPTDRAGRHDLAA